MSENKIEEIVQTVKELKVNEVADLVSALEKELGVNASSFPVAASASPAASAPVAEEKTEFDVVLNGFGEKKIDVIKVVKKIANLGLKDAKSLVESAPKSVLSAVSKDDAEKYKKELEDAGADVKLV